MGRPHLLTITLCVLSATACAGADADGDAGPAKRPATLSPTPAPTATPTATPQTFRPKRYACSPRRTPEVAPQAPEAWRTRAPRSPVASRSRVTLGLKARGRKRELKVTAEVRTARRGAKPITRTAVLRRGKWATVRLPKAAVRSAGTYTVVWRDRGERFISCDGFRVKKG